jgi:hypothetical protein
VKETIQTRYILDYSFRFFSNLYLPKSITSTKSSLKSFTGFNNKLGNQNVFSGLCYPLQLSLFWIMILEWFKMLN